MRKILLSLSLCLLACDEGDDKSPGSSPSPTEVMSSTDASTGDASTFGPQTDGGSTSTGDAPPSMCASAPCVTDAGCGPGLACVKLLDYPTMICAEPCGRDSLCNTAGFQCPDMPPVLTCKGYGPNDPTYCTPIFCVSDADCDFGGCVDSLCRA